MNRIFDSLQTQSKYKKIALTMIGLSFILTPVVSLLLLICVLIFKKLNTRKALPNAGLIIISLYLMYLISDGADVHTRTFIYEWLFSVIDWRSFVPIITAFVWYNFSDYLIRTTGEVMLAEAISEEKKEIPDSVIPYELWSNLLVIGTTRSGKSVLMEHEAEYAIRHNLFVFIISGKNGAHDCFSLRHVVESLCRKYSRPFYLISTSPSEPDAVSFNPHSDCDGTTIVDIHSTLSSFSEEHYLIAFREYLCIICDLLFATNTPISLQALVDIYDYKDFVKFVNASSLESSEKRRFTESARTCAKIAADSRGRIAEILSGRGKNIFSNGKNTVKLSTVRSERGVIMFDLDGLDAPDLSFQVATMALGALAHLISNEPKDTIREKKLIVLDELSIFFCKYIPRIYGLASGYGYKTVSGSQSFSDIEKLDPSLKKETVENSQQFAFLLQNEPSDADYAASIIGTKPDIEKTKRINGLDYSEAGTEKIVRSYKVHPDKFKELKTCEGYFLQKLPSTRVIHFNLDYVDCSEQQSKTKKTKKKKRVLRV